MNIYIIDTSSLIEMKNKYPKKVFPTLWKKIEELISKNRLISPMEVKKELEKGNDELSKWIKQKETKRMFIPPDQVQIEKVKEIIKKYPFLSEKDKPSNTNADPWLIALALSKITNNLFNQNYKDYIIVTEESSKKHNKIPAVCKDFNISCVKLLKMIELLEWTF